MEISAAAAIIGLREAIEAILIIAIFLAYLEKTGNQKYKKSVWVGVIMAITASVFAGIAIYMLFGEINEQMEQLFEGAVMVFTAALLTSVILWMLKGAASIKTELEDKIGEKLDEGKERGLLFLSFIVVFREGVETVLFLTGFSLTQGFIPVLVGTGMGIGLALLLGIGFVRGSEVLSLKTFFNVTSVLLIFFAAGLFSYGIHEFQEAGLFGASWQFWNVALFDFSGVLDDKNDFLGVILRSLFGYQDRPSLLEITSYLGYWLFVLLFYYFGVRRNKLGEVKDQGKKLSKKAVI